MEFIVDEEKKKKVYESMKWDRIWSYGLVYFKQIVWIITIAYVMIYPVVYYFTTDTFGEYEYVETLDFTAGFAMLMGLFFKGFMELICSKFENEFFISRRKIISFEYKDDKLFLCFTVKHETPKGKKCIDIFDLKTVYFYEYRKKKSKVLLWGENYLDVIDMDVDYHKLDYEEKMSDDEIFFNDIYVQSIEDIVNEYYDPEAIEKGYEEY